MRNLFLFVMLCIGFLHASAQEVNVDSVTNHSFGGVVTAQHGSKAYTYYISGVGDEKKKMAALNVVSFGPQLEPNEKMSIDVSKTTIVLTSAFVDGFYIFLLGDPAAKTRTMVQFNRDGKVGFTKKEEGVAPAAFAKTLQYKIYSTMPEGVAVIIPGGKNGSYNITCYNSRNFEEKWKQEFVPKSGTMEVILFNQFMERLMVLEKSKPDSKKERYIYNLRTIILDRGIETDNTELKDAETGEYFYPSFITEERGSDFTGGIYYKDGIFDEKNPGGILAGQISPNGRMGRRVKIAFAELKKFIPDNVVNSIQNGSQLILQDIFRSRNNELVISCELVTRKYDAASGEAKVTISNPFLIYTNYENEIVGVSSIPDIPATNLSIKGRIAGSNIFTLASWLKNEGLFAYRFNSHINSEPHVCYTYLDSGSKKAILFPADSPMISKMSSLPLDRMKAKIKMDKSGVINISTDENDGILPIWQYQKIVFTENETLYMYNLSEPRLLITRIRRF